MRVIEQKIIKVITQCIDGDRLEGSYELSDHDTINFYNGVISYVLWDSEIFRIILDLPMTLEHPISRVEFSNKGWKTVKTHSRLKVLISEFIPNVYKLMIRDGVLQYHQYGQCYNFDLSNNNVVDIP